MIAVINSALLFNSICFRETTYYILTVVKYQLLFSYFHDTYRSISTFFFITVNGLWNGMNYGFAVVVPINSSNVSYALRSTLATVIGTS